ncbi:MAG: hypothetical protein ABIS18_08030 [Actinomycetota bacterium]
MGSEPTSRSSFVHGNSVDAADWYPVRDQLKAAAWTDQEMYALSYNGLGANNGSALFTGNPQRDQEHTDMGWDGQTRVTSNEVNVADLYALKVHPELRSDLAAFVAIAGANKGTSFCPPASEGVVVSCDEIAAGTPWLEALNGPGGADETYLPAKWLTIFDGTGVGDPAFAGPTYADSPKLLGADNRSFPFAYHNDLRMDPAIVSVYRQFLQQSE